MQITEYQEAVGRVMEHKPIAPLNDFDTLVTWFAIGLNSESGEILEHIKKGIFHGHGVNIHFLVEELGDVLWYVTALCEQFDLSLAEVMIQNVDKLKLYYPNRFTPQDSIKRSDVDDSK